MLPVDQAASRVGRSQETIRRWIRTGRLGATSEQGRWMIDPADLDAIRDERYPMLPLPPEWRLLDDGSPAPNWVAAVTLLHGGR